MKAYVCIAFMLLVGCITPEQRYRQGVQECTAIADAYGLGASRRAYIESCARMQPGGGGGYANVPASGSAYGHADAFGPYGVWGPSWQDFNGQFQNPPPQRSTIVPPTR